MSVGGTPCPRSVWRSNTSPICSKIRFISVLAAAARRIGSGRASKPNEEISQASIPIPDAAGIVESWQDHYPAGRWVDPDAYVKSSDSVEQTIEGFLLNGISYDMDERDVAWLDNHNSAAKGEGTSASAGSPDRARGVKTRGKDTSLDQPSFVITENEFELTMGLFEKFTDEKCPYLHLVCSFPSIGIIYRSDAA